MRATAYCLSSFLVCLLPGRLLHATPPVSGSAFTSVKLDGVRLGNDTAALFPGALFPTVVYDPASGRYQMWVSNATFTIPGTIHATSTDGVNFSSAGNLAGYTFVPGTFGAADPPLFEFVRAARNNGTWKIMYWTENGPGQPVPRNWGQYNYDSSVNDIGASPNNLTVTHQGPISGGTFGQTIGPWGLIAGAFFTQYDSVGGVGKFTYTDGMPPASSALPVATKDFVTPLGFTYMIPTYAPGTVYVHNVGRVLDQADGTYGAYFSLRYVDGTRVNKEIYYSESSDGGSTWANPVGLFANGNTVTIDGLPNTFEFSHPEAVQLGSCRFLYFSTKASDGKFVVGTNSTQPLSAVSVSTTGSLSVCPASTGGTATVTDTGGAPNLHQWVYRTTQMGASTPISGQTGSSYLVKGADFGVPPGTPGLYYLYCLTTSSCSSQMFSPETIIVTVSADGTSPSVTAPAALTTAQTLCQ